MKRITLFVFPILATMLAVGFGLLLVRTQAGSFRPRLLAVRAAVGRVVEEVVEEVGEEIEEALEEARQ